MTQVTEFFAKLESLAAAARPIDQWRSEKRTSDYGSERQIAAQNAFFDFVQKHMHPMAFAELEEYALKATPDEMIDEALRWFREE